jgi:CRP-like cAMP-binding protein/predicted acylesterase/phospholipase RssA
MSVVPEAWLGAFRLAGFDVEGGAAGRMAAAFRERVLEAGDYLVRQGEEGDSLFVVMDGRLAAEHDGPEALLLQELGAGDVVGEIALLAGGPRSASVRALERSRVLGLTRDGLAALLETNPEVGDALSASLHQRLRRSKLAGHLRALFGELDAEARRDVERRLTWVTLEGGARLFRQGDPPDGAYIVAVGRLRVAVEAPGGGERAVDEVGPGEWVGEMGLLANRPRSATVYALRDSELVWLSGDDFAELSARHPRLLLQTSRALVERLQRHLVAPAGARRAARTFAVVPLGRGADVAWFVDELARALGAYGPALCLTEGRVDEGLGKPGAARAPREGAAQLRVASWLAAQEGAHDTVLYLTDAAWTEWTARALRHADHVLLVADGGAPPALAEVEAEWRARGGGERPARQSLVLLQPGGRCSYPGTARWFAGRSLHGHHHVRRGRAADVARVARLLTGNAVGVVFGGGGSRGYAHIGVARALDELGVPVDAAGGTSVGAVVAAARALEFDAAEMLRVVPPLMRAAFFEPTLPVVSLMKGERALAGVREALGPVDVEDFVLPFFAVSTNLSRNQVHVHRTGPAAPAVLASGAVPGILPPVPWGDDLLVDGGLSNNVPADVMMALVGERVVASDVIPEIDLNYGRERPPADSRWAAALGRLNPLARANGLPSIFNILMRSATTSSKGLRPVDLAACPRLLYLRPPVSRWNMMDFAAAEPLADEGYRGTREALGAWWARERPGARPGG